MVISQLKIGVWSFTLFLLALFGVEVAVYYDPLQFNSFVIQQVFKFGDLCSGLTRDYVCFLLSFT